MDLQTIYLIVGIVGLVLFVAFGLSAVIYFVRKDIWGVIADLSGKSRSKGIAAETSFNKRRDFKSGRIERKKQDWNVTDGSQESGRDESNRPSGDVAAGSADMVVGSAHQGLSQEKRSSLIRSVEDIDAGRVGKAVAPRSAKDSACEGDNDATDVVNSDGDSPTQVAGAAALSAFVAAEGILTAASDDNDTLVAAGGSYSGKSVAKAVYDEALSSSFRLVRNLVKVSSPHVVGKGGVLLVYRDTISAQRGGR